MRSIEDLIVALCSLPLKLSRGDGISMLQAIDESGYRGNESAVKESDIRQYLSEQPQLVREWSLYSENKRTDTGWYFDYELMQVGLFVRDGREHIRTFDDVASACSCFIKNEIDLMLDMSL